MKNRFYRTCIAFVSIALCIACVAMPPSAPVITIRFFANDGSGRTADAVVTEGVEATLPVCAFLRPGLAFAGWASEPAGPAIYEDGQGIVARDGLSLYAKWTVAMATIPAGRFHIFEPGPGDRTPPMYQDVSSFRLAMYEVTQALFEQVMGHNGSRFKDPGKPVESVSWYEAIAFCNRLSLAEGLRPVYSVAGKAHPDEWGPIPAGGKDAIWDAATSDWDADGYRLPTDMEWRLACEGGVDDVKREFAGDPNLQKPDDDPGGYAWYAANSKDIGEASPEYGTHAVGLKWPNEFGIYDLSGNVYEWCWDWQGLRGYYMGDQMDFRGYPEGRTRQIHGGAWFFGADRLGQNVTSTEPFAVFDFLGIRLARKL